jgi:Flp pilus assembly protein TadD
LGHTLANEGQGVLIPNTMARTKFSARCSVFALTLLLPVSAFAQITPSPNTQPFPRPTTPSYPTTGVPAPVLNPNDPGSMLPVYLKILSQNPYDVDALMNAGGAAIAVGDPNAALGFLARAEELSPRNGRVKNLLGSAFTMVERPDDALRYFNEALLLGMTERDVVKDRGLAYDLKGDPKRAQKDYQTALRYSGDIEVIRRYALSLGAAGEKQVALEKLEPLIRRNDQGAWRARAFVLAMNGEVTEASRIARQVTPLSMAASMDQFLRRLGSLNASQRARAVNFGSMPAEGVRYASVDTGESFRAISPETAAVLTPRGSPSNSAQSQRPVQVSREDPREARRRERQERELAKLADRGRRNAERGRGTQIAVLDPPKLPTVAPIPTPRVTPPPAPVPAPRVTSIPTPVQSTLAAPVSDIASRRVGQRIGPVDPERLPPEMRTSAPLPSGAASSATSVPSTTRVTVVPGATELPPPDGVRPLERVSIAPFAVPTSPVTVNPVPAATVTPPKLASADTPKPVFEIPPVVPKPTPIALTPPVSTPAAPLPAKIDLAPKPLVAEPVVAAPKPTPPDVQTPTTVATVASPFPALAPTATPPEAKPIPVPGFSLPPAPKPTDASPLAGLPTTATPSPVAPSPAPTQIMSVALPPSEVKPAVATAVDPASVTPPRPDVTLPSATVPTATVPVVPKPVEVAVASPPPSTSGVTAPLPVGTDVVPPAAAGNSAAAATPDPPPASLGLGAVIEGLELEEQSAAAPVPTDAQLRAMRITAQRKVEAEAKAKEKADADAKAAKAAKLEADAGKLAEDKKKVDQEAADLKKNPARLWVQIAMGSNKAGLPITWRKLRAEAPKALGDQTVWYAPFRATNRLVVGPLKSSGAARSLVTSLSKEGVQATTWASDAGEEVSRLGGK